MSNPRQIDHDPNEKPGEIRYGWDYLFTIIAFSLGLAYVRDPEAVSAGLASWKAGIASWFGF